MTLYDVLLIFAIILTGSLFIILMTDWSYTLFGDKK